MKLFKKDEETKKLEAIGKNNYCRYELKEDGTSILSIKNEIQRRIVVSRETILQNLKPVIGKGLLNQKAEELDRLINAVRPNKLLEILWDNDKTYLIVKDSNGEPKLISETDTKLYVQINNCLKESVGQQDIVAFTNAITGKQTYGEDNKPKNYVYTEPNYIPDNCAKVQSMCNENQTIISDQYGNQYAWIPDGILKNGKKVRGFFVSSYEISEGTGKYPMSIPGQIPWTDVTRDQASAILKQADAKLITENQYQLLCELAEELYGPEKVYSDSTEIGSYYEYGVKRQPYRTGEKIAEYPYGIHGVHGLAGGVWIISDDVTLVRKHNEQTGKIEEDFQCSAFGGSTLNDGMYTLASKYYFAPNAKSPDMGFRAVK